MAQRNRRGAQLSVELPPELLQRLKGYAAAHSQPVSALVRRWVELGLSGDLEAGAPAPAAGGAGLLERVAALEAAVALLQARPVERTLKRERTRPAVESLPLLGDLPAGEAEPPAPLLPPPDGAISTAQLAEVLGMKRGSLNERIRRAGGAQIGMELEGWRCVGQHRPEGGGPPQWLWERN